MLGICTVCKVMQRSEGRFQKWPEGGVGGVISAAPGPMGRDSENVHLKRIFHFAIGLHRGFQRCLLKRNKFDADRVQ